MCITSRFLKPPVFLEYTSRYQGSIHINFQFLQHVSLMKLGRKVLAELGVLLRLGGRDKLAREGAVHLWQATQTPRGYRCSEYVRGGVDVVGRGFNTEMRVGHAAGIEDNEHPHTTYSSCCSSRWRFASSLNPFCHRNATAMPPQCHRSLFPCHRQRDT